jgi:dTDP-4-dehydrorhamnose reductase
LRILILGANGLLGGACYRLMTQVPNLEVFGSVRSKLDKSVKSSQRLIGSIDVLDAERLDQLFSENKPQVVINCTSLSKSMMNDADPLRFIELYSVLPHSLARLCSRYSARLIHISSDGVFSGKKGNYREIDKADADDLYGRSKFLGEVTSPNCITIRTSIIGHDNSLQNGLISWYLSNKYSCKGYTKSIFSGLPVCVLAQILVDFVIPNPNLEGIYHIGSDPISKFDLLTLVAEIYDSPVIVIPDNSVKINRSLNTEKFQREALYSPPNWNTLVSLMYDDYLRFYK